MTSQQRLKEVIDATKAGVPGLPIFSLCFLVFSGPARMTSTGIHGQFNFERNGFEHYVVVSYVEYVKMRLCKDESIVINKR